MPQFKSSDIATFFTHWQSLCVNGAIPTTETYLDQVAPHLAPMLLIYDYSDDDLMIRFQGTVVLQRWGEDLTGQSWFTRNHYLPTEKVLANCKSCLDHPCGVWGESTFVTKTGRAVAMENIMLPLAAKAGRPPRLVNFSSLLETLKDKDGPKAHVEPRRMNWLDAGFGIPSYPMQRRTT